MKFLSVVTPPPSIYNYKLQVKFGGESKSINLFNETIGNIKEVSIYGEWIKHNCDSVQYCEPKETDIKIWKYFH